MCTNPNSESNHTLLVRYMHLLALGEEFDRCRVQNAAAINHVSAFPNASSDTFHKADITFR
jgi:hypothetical protein